MNARRLMRKRWRWITRPSWIDVAIGVALGAVVIFVVEVMLGWR
jgi:hypothetical protein